MIDLHAQSIPVDSHMVDLVRDKVLAFIFPNNPRTDSDTEAFEKAVLYQYEHEMTQAIKTSDEIPDGVQSFSIGDFHMSFDKDWLETRLTRKTICPAAYGVLLRQGLLYRGVEGRC